MDDAQIQTGFVRNRRFLIAVSLALACINVLGLRFTQVSIFGNSASINNPEHVFTLAWIFWIWAFVQYIVWFIDANAWKQFRAAIVADCEKSLGDKLAAIEGIIPEWLTNQLAGELKMQTPPEYFSKIRYLCRYTGMHGDGKRIERAADIEVTAHVRLPNQRGGAQAGPVRIEREVQIGEWRRRMLVSVLKVVFTRRYTLEYFAPFLIGILPVVLWVLSHKAQYLV